MLLHAEMSLMSYVILHHTKLFWNIVQSVAFQSDFIHCQDATEVCLRGIVFSLDLHYHESLRSASVALVIVTFRHFASVVYV